MQGVKELKLISAIIGGAGLFVLIHALLSPSDGMSGMDLYSGTSMLLATVGASMFAGGFVYTLFGGDRKVVESVVCSPQAISAPNGNGAAPQPAAGPQTAADQRGGSSASYSGSSMGARGRCSRSSWSLAARLCRRT